MTKRSVLAVALACVLVVVVFARRPPAVKDGDPTDAVLLAGPTAVRAEYQGRIGKSHQWYVERRNDGSPPRAATVLIKDGYPGPTVSAELQDDAVGVVRLFPTPWKGSGEYPATLTTMTGQKVSRPVKITIGIIPGD